MKLGRIVLNLLLITLLVFVWRSLLSSSSDGEESQPSEEIVLSPEPILSQENPLQATASVVIDEPEQPPVQSVEERGDALLFEIDALGGTPFDQSILMPFE